MKQIISSCYHLQMKIFHTENHVLHHCQGEMKDGVLRPCFEHPGRAHNVLEALHQAGYTDLQTPDDFGMQPLMAVHKSDYLAFLQTVWNDWTSAGRTGDIFPLVWPGRRMRRNVKPEGIDGKIGLYAFDSGTPICAGTWQVAYESAQCALSAARHIRRGHEQMAFSFTRPPGHHAMAGQYGGYCFINHAAVAAQYLREDGLNRVAILDVDYHHGNGSQSIFYDRPDVLVVNIHCDPKVEIPLLSGSCQRDRHR